MKVEKPCRRITELDLEPHDALRRQGCDRPHVRLPSCRATCRVCLAACAQEPRHLAVRYLVDPVRPCHK